MTYDDWKLEAPPDAPEPPEWLEWWRSCPHIPANWEEPTTREDAIRGYRFAIEELEDAIAQTEEMEDEVTA